MTHLRVLAPVLVDYFSIPGAQLSDPASYAAFWRDAQESVSALLADLVPTPTRTAAVRASGATSPTTEESVAPPAGADVPEFRFEHTQETGSINRYQTIGDDAVDRPVHVLSGTLLPEHLPGAFDDITDPVQQATETITFRLYDHGTLILEFLADVTEYLGDPDDRLEARLDTVQANAVALGETVARALVKRYLDPVLNHLRARDKNEIIAAQTPMDDPQVGDFGGPQWVTRSLIVDPGEAGTERILRHWLKDVAIDGATRPPAEELLDGDRDHLLRWLNYMFIDRTGTGSTMEPGTPFFDQWDALRYAQVIYGSVDRIDTRLSRVLADSAAAESRLELEVLQAELNALSRQAELIILEHHDLAKYMKRSVRLEHNAILEYWNYRELLEEPVKYKVELCNQRLAELASRRTARSAMFTDIILLAIAMTSVLATAVALTEFGRNVAADPDMAVYDFGQSSLVAWVAAQPADAILISSSMISILIVMIYLYFRGDGGS